MSMHSRLFLPVACLLLAGCSAPVRETAPAPAASPAAAPVPCVAPEGPVPRPGFCSLPADVRAFVEDRDGCDHFRGEPWPEGDDEGSRARRQQILQAMRSLCAGTDRQLEALLARYREDAAVMHVLSGFERNIESAP